MKSSRPRLKRLGKRLFFLLLRNLCDGFLAIGTLNARHYRSYGIAAPRIFSVPYAVDNAFFQAQARAARHSHRGNADLLTFFGVWLLELAAFHPGEWEATL